jgi:hypothetical protein
VKATFQKNLLGTMKVKSLKNLAQKLMRIPAMRQDLVFLTDDPDYENVKVRKTEIVASHPNVLSSGSSPKFHSVSH